MADKLQATITVFTGSSVNSVENPVAISVTDASDSSPVSVFADREGETATGNPFNASGSVVSFFCDPVLADIEVDDGVDTLEVVDIRVGFSVDQFDLISSSLLNGGVDKVLVFKASEKTFRHDMIQAINGFE